MRPRVFDFIVTKAEFDEAANGVFKMITNGSLSIEVFKEYPLADAAQAHIDLEGRKTMAKLLLRI